MHFEPIDLSETGNLIAELFGEKSAELGKIDFSEKRPYFLLQKFEEFGKIDFSKKRQACSLTFFDEKSADLGKIDFSEKGKPIALPFDEKSADLGKIDLSKKR